MKILLTICARGGSKGVPLKNLRKLAGIPLIAHSIRQAKKWGRASHIVVSTDSEAIRSASIEHGAEAPFLRPAELATDDAPKLPTIRHALLACEELYGEKYDLLVDLDATAPVRTVQDLENCLELFQKKKPNKLFSVVDVQKNPYFNMCEIDGEGYAVLCKKLPRLITYRQEAPEVYSLNGAIFFYDTEYLRSLKSPELISPRSIIYKMPDIAAIDIDREIDFKFIEFLAAEGLWKPE